MQVTLGSAQKILWGSIVNFQNKQKTSCKFFAAPRRTVERQDFVELGAFELTRASYSWRVMETCPKLYCCLAKKHFLVQIADQQLFFWYGESYGKFPVIWFSS
jgi:hypothetical protein